MVDTRRSSTRERNARNVNALLVEEALSTWVIPSLGVGLLAAALVLDALGALSEPSAAFATVVALLILGAFTVIRPLLGNPREARLRPRTLAGIGVLWVALFIWPFALRLFPGSPIATTPVDARHTGGELPVGPGRFDLVLDAHLPLAADRHDRQLHYDLTLVDGGGQPHRFEGELGDRWQTRRLGRRGTAPVHLEHLSASYEVDNPNADPLRINDVVLAGVPEATLGASIYHHRIPGFAWLLAGGILLVIGALAFDLWWDAKRTPTAAFLTATAMGAVLIFCSSAAGHPGIRQVFGAAIIGALGGVPMAAIAAWLARRSSWARAITLRGAA